MTFYEKIILELESQKQSLSTIYDYAFRFTNEALFEWDENGQICTLRYGEAKKMIESASFLLHNRLASYPHGAPVGIYLPNGISWVVSFWAILRAGFRPLLLNLNAPEGTAEKCLVQAGAEYVIADSALSAGETIDPSFLLQTGDSDYCDWSDEILLCTSGTTGDPKIIEFNGQAVCAQIRNSGYVLKHNRSVATFYHGHIKLLAFLPFYHIFGLSTVLLWFSCFGRTMVLLPSLSPAVIQDVCQRHEVTHIFAPPIFWNSVTDGVIRAAKRTGKSKKLESGIRLSLALQNGPFPKIGQVLSRFLMRSVQKQALGAGVRFCITGGGAVRKDTLRLMNGIGYPLRNGYGMTEIGIASVDLSWKAKERMEGSIGKLFPSMEGKLSDGTLHVRGKTCFSATYRNGVRYPHDPMEWFDTEDFITIRPDQTLFFSGRRDDMLNGENGERISPAEIESVFGCPQIAQLCVIALPQGPDSGSIALIVEPKLRNAYSLGVLSKSLYQKNDSLPMGYRVQKIMYADQPLPLASTMKVQTSAVREKLVNGTLTLSEAQRVSDSSEQLFVQGMDQVLPVIIDTFHEITGMDDISPDTHFQYDLRGDSLTYFCLIDQLTETFGVSFDSKDLSLNTPREFAEYILRESD